MPQAIIYLNEEEDEKVKDYSKKWRLSKHETIKRIINEFTERRFKDGKEKSRS